MVNSFVCIILIAALHNVWANTLQLANLYSMQNGLGWPNVLHVAEGHEALMKLADHLVSQDSCTVTTPQGVTFNVHQPPNTRYETWDDCGVRVKNVVKEDLGRWRFTSHAGNDTLTGWTELHVEDNIDQYHAVDITLQDGRLQSEVELSTLSNSYCLVTQPFTESSLIPGHCTVNLNRITRAVQGNWRVLLGLPGRISELEVDRRVTVESENLDAGFISQTNPPKLHLYCNIMNTEKNVTFCRFQKTNTVSGFNVVDGLSDGQHTYYGEGFPKRHCGVTIENPTYDDYGTWKCTVGVQEWEGNTIVRGTPFQALIRVSTATTRNVVRNVREVTEEHLFFGQNGQSVTFGCQADTSLTYCWFQHPNGSQFTPVPQTDDEQLFWYSGEGLQGGYCGITFAHVTEEDGGLWTCHMGPRGEVGVEMTDRVTLRVTGALAARQTEVTATVGANVTLYCHSSSGNRPLSYCRFLSPTFLGINIDSSVTQENAILNRFYFTPGRELDYGDCSLTINPLTAEDYGNWTCAAVVDDDPLESRDTVTVVHEHKATPQARAGIIGMGVGVSILFLIFGGVMVYRYGGKIPLKWPSNNANRSTATGSSAVMFYNEGSSGRVSVMTTGSESSADSQPQRQN